MRLTLLVLLVALAFPPPPARAAIYAVVVGVDDYETLPRLGGAVNDARDIARALRALGADVIALENAEVSRQSVLDALAAQARRARAGDLFVFSFAGHGIQEPEAIPGDEADGMDETIVFPRFAFDQPGAGDRLRDNEIGAILDSVDPAARRLVIVDSCHSGTMTRAADPRGRPLVTRFGGIGRISDDPLPAPPAATRGRDLAGANTVFVAAARDDEQIPEVEIDGMTRGAVSWSVARALEGAGDFGGPGMDLGQFRAFVRAQGRALSATRQSPDVVYDRAALAGATLVPQGAAPAPAAPADDAWRRTRPPVVFALGGAPAGLTLSPLGEWTEDRGAADLIWDRRRGELIDRAGADLVAEARSPSALRPALESWAAIRGLQRWAPRRAAELVVRPEGRRHRLGDMVELAAARPAAGAAYLTVVNIASDGRAQFVFPDDASKRFGDDLLPAGEGMVELGAAAVSEPVGADHVVAVWTAERRDALHGWLAGGPPAGAVVERLRELAEAEPTLRIGVAPIYTTR